MYTQIFIALFVCYQRFKSWNESKRTDNLLVKSSNSINSNVGFVNDAVEELRKESNAKLSKLAREIDELRSINIQTSIKVFDRLDKIDRIQETNANTLRAIVTRIGIEWKDDVTVVKSKK